MATSIGQIFETASETGFVAGRSQAIQMINATVEELARTDMPVLIHGESGTGKEVYSQRMHRLSDRCTQPLVKLGCTVIEPRELFAAFQATDEERLETLLLDNVEELSPECQRVLLSLLQAAETRLAGRAGLRFISTATRDLDQDTRAGRFRRELYYRIAGVKIRLPALWERKEDIPELLEFFLQRSARQLGRTALAITGEEMDILQSYKWPGNIRELDNLARKIAALGTRQAIEEVKNGAETRNGVGTASGSVHSMGRPALSLGRTSLKAVAREASRQAERDLILKALERTHWNRKQAAKELQISYKALLYKIKQMGMPGELRSEGEER